MKQFYETYCPGSEFNTIFRNITSLNTDSQNNIKVSPPATQIAWASQINSNSYNS